MSFEVLNTQLGLSRDLINIQGYCGGIMEGRVKRTYLARGQKMDDKRSLSEGRAFPSNYFSVKSFLSLICLTASLLILPLILPPLPPPPITLMLLPVGLLVVLLILAFMPSDIQDITSSYL